MGSIINYTTVMSGDPVGSLLAWPTETPPAGYLHCDGSSLLIASYPELYFVLGKRYGSADTSHFNLPDFRGRFLRGWASGEADDPDRASRTAPAATGATISAGDHVGTEQADAFQGHSHVIGLDDSNNSKAQGSLPITGGTSVGMIQGTGDSRWEALSASSLGSYGTPRESTESRSKNTTVMICIKYTLLFAGNGSLRDGTQILTDAASITVNWALGGTAMLTLARASTQFTFTGGYNGQRCVLILKQYSGLGAVTFTSEVRGCSTMTVPPTITQTDGKKDYLGFIYNADDSKYDFVSLTQGY